ncbi:dnaJ-like protein subfamily C member 25 [Hibiscus syriacus]|uniref:DnaJ-like protein subfamily C member 25 n=1 Tax=Hibiscus syriacus TaxID=106335 RepID=A0A6A3CVQ6_HIBSY|nr:dnaJ-like protein subfamily C member 25 [Hibiscus syriacus]
MMDWDPPFHETYKALYASTTETSPKDLDRPTAVEECELPLINLSRLCLEDEVEKESCKEEIARAAIKWLPLGNTNSYFAKAITMVRSFSHSHDRYLQLWIETMNIAAEIACRRSLAIVFSSVELFATKVANLAQELAQILAEKSGHNYTFFQENSLLSTCYLQLNRYPPCPVQLFGLMPYTDSNFLTVLHQNQIGGLQLMKDGKWIAVQPNPDALFINIGDLFQAWSNDRYKSVQHCVVTNPTKERYSAAYFLCPSYETVIESCRKPSVYRRFSFKEYRQQVREDVQNYGDHKVGLTRFLV